MILNPSNQVIVICGPTASGKSGLAVELAKLIDAEIVSADSMQIYRELDIGTAKVSPEIQAIICHHMIDIIEPDQTYSVAQYSKTATTVIKEVLAKGKSVIICGGTGQYINALLDGLIFVETQVNKAVRKEINKTITTDNALSWHSKLEKLDAQAGERISVNDLRRIRRFFEVYQTTGLTQTQIYNKSHAKGPDFNFLSFYLYPDRQQLYTCINQRTEEMFELGLVEEVKNILNKYPLVRKAQSFQAIGYKETTLYLDGKAELSTIKERIKQVTRNYAKRQFTWFNARNDLNVINDFGNLNSLEQILKLLGYYK
ncbi:MAG: tRNA (adenosine(37)-N6)-dimethylallyltransferase MiaA [Clostridiaceae bacterium]|nr:tRNA (adenosine(37)-N6)-dimethylallyltransferase MiaA [Clostridiaceae bacterium]